jgi:putative ABC transport system permease protein
VSWAADLPLAMSRLLIWFAPSEERPSDDSEYVFIDCDIVGPNYFRTMGIPLLRGRDFTYQDNGDLPVVIVNDAMARQYWGRDKTSSGNVST